MPLRYFVTFHGETHTLKDWSRQLGVSAELLYQRYHAGLPPHLILSTVWRCMECHIPVGKHNRRCRECQTAFARARAEERHGIRQAMAPDPAGVNQIAHCGTWHPVPTIPHALPCCGTVLQLQGSTHAAPLE